MHKPLVVVAVAALATAVVVPLTAASATTQRPRTPSHALSPGAYSTATTARVCHGVTQPKLSLKVTEQVFTRYHLSYAKAHKSYVLQHVIPVNLGGTNAIKNLWPMPANGYVKDFTAVDHTLRTLVCARKTVSLHTAQHALAVNWFAAYTHYHVPVTKPAPVPPAPPVSTPVEPAPTPAPPTAIASPVPSAGIVLGQPCEPSGSLGTDTTGMELDCLPDASGALVWSIEPAQASTPGNPPPMG